MIGKYQRPGTLGLAKQRKLSQTACWPWSCRWASSDLSKRLLGQLLTSMLPRALTCLLWAVSNWASNYSAFQEFPTTGLEKLHEQTFFWYNWVSGLEIDRYKDMC